LRCRVCVGFNTKSYSQANPGAQAARNAKRVASGGHIRLTEGDKQGMWRRQKYLCLCCGKRIDDPQQAEGDHGTPVAKGGSHEQSNLFLAHPQCNQEKHAKTLDEHWVWRAKVGLSGKRPAVGR